MNVLIVEDNPISARVLEHTLDKHGYETYTASDGSLAMEYLETHPEVDLVITDLVMPNIDGAELVRNIKARPEWCDLPVVVCTSVKSVNVSQALSAQGCKYVFKPIRADSLMQKVKEVVAQRRPILQTPEQTMVEIGMDFQGFLEVLDAFVKEVDDTIRKLEQQMQEDPLGVVNLRDLMESAKLVRADRLTDILSRVNQTPVGGERSDRYRALYPSLLRELKALQHYLTLYSS
jgi:CheY-like chemotaxis protein